MSTVYGKTYPWHIYHYINEKFLNAWQTYNISDQTGAFNEAFESIKNPKDAK
jgi:hypothetical protein